MSGGRALSESGEKGMIVALAILEQGEVIVVEKAEGGVARDGDADGR